MITATQAPAAPVFKDRLKSVRAIAGMRAPFGSGPLRLALVGPDGVGKSTIIKTATEWMARELPSMEVTVRQWRPGLLPSLATLLGRPENVRANQGPRREPGPFHAVRLIYYYFDFLLGRLLKDYRILSKPALIVYDRCALDMAVDPVRFGLQSFRGTRLLWKLVPKLDLLVLLYDTPDRIWQRKREINKLEMEEQLRIWLRYVSEDQVHAVIRIDAEPEEISSRFQDLLLETLLRKHGRNCAPEQNQTSPLTCIRSISGAETVAARNIEFAMVPRASAPRFLIPLAERRLAASALDLYNPQRLRARWSTRLLKRALRAGLAQPFLRDRVQLDIHLKEHLQSIFGVPEAALSVSLGTPGWQQKPVLQVMDSDGRILGYAKVGWNPDTIRLVRNEEIGLRKLEGVPFSTAKIPALAHAGWWKGNYVLAQSCCGPAPQAAPRSIDHRHIDFLVELYRGAALRELAWQAVFRLTEVDAAAIRNRGSHYCLHLLEQAAQYCRRRIGERPVPCGRAHGDFTPWNIRACGRRLLIVDWEHAADVRPAGWDLFHFLIQTAGEIQDRSPGAVYRMLLHPGNTNTMIRRYCERLAIPANWIAPLLVCYLAATIKESLDVPRQEQSAKDELLRRTWGVLLTLVCYDDTASGGIACES